MTSFADLSPSTWVGQHPPDEEIAQDMLFIQDTTVTETTCECCGAVRSVVRSFVGDDQMTTATVIAYCYPPHLNDAGEIWVDAILGTWGDDQVEDHVTFGCRFGPLANGEESTCSLTDAAQFDDPRPIYGERLTREQALVHPRLGDFWSIVDVVFTTDPTIGDHRARFH
jgi:hypothetical protein